MCIFALEAKKKHFTKEKMKKIVLIFAIVLSVTAVYGQNNTSNKGETEMDYQRLIYLNSLYIQSYIRSDVETFDKLLWAAEFTQTNPDGTLLSREKVMEKFGQPRFDKIVYCYVKDVKVEFLSPDKAVVSAVNPDCFEIDGKIVQSISSYKDTYVKKEGKWKCISAVIKSVR